MALHLTYNRADNLFEVPVSRDRLVDLIQCGINTSGIPKNTDRIYHLNRVGRTASRVLANTSKTSNRCGCPAIMADIAMGKSFLSAGLDDFGQFPNAFDNAVTSYVQGLVDGGVTFEETPLGNPTLYAPIRLIVTGEDNESED
jgi:hypothetical protein